MVIEGLSEFEVISLDQALVQINRSHSTRSVRKTRQNDRSSRSHAVFQVLAESQEPTCLKRSRLSLCDLAGSEKIDKTEKISVEHLNELRNINLSLTCLAKVVHCLARGSKIKPPYR